jgi:hypothetical protein
MNKGILTFLIVILIFYGSKASEIDQNNSFFNLAGLSSNGEDWQVVYHVKKTDFERCHLFHDKWLMNFLHWRPLNERRKNISISYVKELMLSFWGPQMPFKIIGEGGETIISGHQAYFIDGTIYNGMIKTRFIVWNCTETGRQFISDCNINLRKGTPGAMMQVQYDMATAIKCHNQRGEVTNRKLTNKFHLKGYNLTLFKPEGWRTEIFKYKKWYPDGPTPVNGSLWTLITDSEKFIDLSCQDDLRLISQDLFKEYLNKVNGTEFIIKGKFKIKMLVKGQKNVMDRGTWWEGNVDLEFERDSTAGKSVEIFKTRAFLWRLKGKNYFLLAGIIAYQNVWNQPFDLTPNSEIINNFIHHQVLPNIKSFPGNSDK